MPDEKHPTDLVMAVCHEVDLDRNLVSEDSFDRKATAVDLGRDALDPDALARLIGHGRPDALLRHARIIRAAGAAGSLIFRAVRSP